MSWLWLFVAISLEVAATILMKYSNGFTKPLPTFGMVLLYLLSLAPLTIVLKQLEVGAVYAIWSALGTVAVALLGILLFHESATALKVASMALIIAGVIGLNLSGSAGHETQPSPVEEVRNEVRQPNAEGRTELMQNTSR